MPNQITPPYVGAPSPDELWMMYLHADGVQQIGSLASEANYQISLIAARLRDGEEANAEQLSLAGEWMDKVREIQQACLSRLGI